MEERFMRRALELAAASVAAGGGPFGAVVVCEGQIVAEGSNNVTLDCDPTAHAEVVAIRRACATQHLFRLNRCELYTSCEPCPMCLSTAYWAGIEKIYYAASRHDAADAGFDDSLIYDEIGLAPERRRIPSVHMEMADFDLPFRLWASKEDKTRY